MSMLSALYRRGGGGRIRVAVAVVRGLGNRLESRRVVQAATPRSIDDSASRMTYSHPYMCFLLTNHIDGLTVLWQREARADYR